MKANCINCGMEFDDPFPDAIMGMVNAGIEPEEIRNVLRIWRKV